MRQKTIDPLFKTELKEDENGVIDDAEVCYSSSFSDNDSKYFRKA